MISIDTNILFAAVDGENALHEKAVAFLSSLQRREDVGISEFVLMELYGLLRNAIVLKSPRTAGEAASICETFRHHPYWKVFGFPPDSRRFHDALWKRLGEHQFARRRSYDWRIALSLVQQGVTDFATINLKDFKDLGFQRVWNPLEEL